jgi:protein-disulfide isomerase
MRHRHQGRHVFYSLFLVLALIVSSVPADASATEPTQSIAEVNGEAITVEHLDRALGAKVVSLEEQIYTTKRDELEALIAQRLLMQEAAKRGISVAALLDAEITAKVSLITEADINAVFQENKPNLAGVDVTIAREKIRTALQQQRLSIQQKQFVNSLRSQGRVLIRLQPPPVVRVEVLTDGAPFEGAAEAPVTLVEFSDFHCPFCKRVQGTLKQLLDRYPGKIKHVYRNLPIDNLHPHARRAAEAARCAQDQGKFWKYHARLFASAPKASDDDLKHYAEQIGLDLVQFDGCVSQRSYYDLVQRDLQEASQLGVTTTPTFFVNGRLVTGAQPIEKFVQIIEEELARTPASASLSIRKE